MRKKTQCIQLHQQLQLFEGVINIITVNPSTDLTDFKYVSGELFSYILKDTDYHYSRSELEKGLTIGQSLISGLTDINFQPI